MSKRRPIVAPHAGALVETTIERTKTQRFQSRLIGGDFGEINFGIDFGDEIAAFDIVAEFDGESFDLSGNLNAALFSQSTL